MKTILYCLLCTCLFKTDMAFAQEPETIQPITKVVVSDGILLQIERSPNYTLSVKLQELDPECLIKTIENGTLTLKITSGYGCSGKIIANLTCPGLKEMEATSKAEISTKNLMQGDSLKAIMRSGGKAYVDIDVKYLEAIVSGWGLFQSEGYAVMQNIELTTSGTFSGYKLEGDNVNITAYSGGKGKICASETLNAEAGSNGYISFNCDPKKKNLEAKGNARIEPYKE
jgi:hypothetical protein